MQLGSSRPYHGWSWKNMDVKLMMMMMLRTRELFCMLAPYLDICICHLLFSHAIIDNVEEPGGVSQEGARKPDCYYYYYRPVDSFTCSISFDSCRSRWIGETVLQLAALQSFEPTSRGPGEARAGSRTGSLGNGPRTRLQAPWSGESWKYLYNHLPTDNQLMHWYDLSLASGSI